MVRLQVGFLLAVLVTALTLGCGGNEPVGGAGGTSSGGVAGNVVSGGSGGMGGSGNSGGASGASAAGSAGSSGGSDAMEPEGCVADPVELAEAPGAIVLAGEGMTKRFTTVQLGADHVFVTSDLGIERVSKQGGASELVLADTDGPHFRIGGETLYFVREGSLHSVPITATSGTATLVAADIGIDEPNDNLLAIDAGFAYLWARATGAITRLELTSGQISPVVEDTSNIAWQLYDGFMYYGDDFDRILRVPLAGGEPEVVYTPHEVVWSLAVGTPGLFIGSYGAVYVQAEPVRVAIFEDPFKLNASQMYFERVAIHGDRLLFTGSAIGDNRLGWTKLDGSSCATYKADLYPDYWAFDDTHLYVAAGTKLYKITP